MLSCNWESCASHEYITHMQHAHAHHITHQSISRIITSHDTVSHMIHQDIGMHIKLHMHVDTRIHMSYVGHHDGIVIIQASSMSYTCVRVCMICDAIVCSCCASLQWYGTVRCIDVVPYREVQRKESCECKTLGKHWCMLWSITYVRVADELERGGCA